MEQRYREIQIYYERGKRVALFSTGELKSFGGVIAIGKPIELGLPCSENELVVAIDSAFSNCYRESKEAIEKVSEIEKHFKVVGFKKIVKMFDVVNLTWSPESGYSFLRAIRDPKGYYNLLPEESFGEELDYGRVLEIVGGS